MSDRSPLPRMRRLPTALVTAVLAATTIVAGAASATALPRRGPLLTVVIGLRPAGGTARLAALAARAAVPARARHGVATDLLVAGRAELARVSPSTSARSAVVGWLDAHGLTVRRSTAWSITASGPAALVRGYFGAGLPGVLRPFAVGALGAAPAPPWRPMSIPVNGLTPAAVQAAYQRSSAGAGLGLTVATVQLSGWNAVDHAAYLRAAGLPTAPLTQVPVDGASVSRETVADGSLEVTLDADAISAVAPLAAQRVYIGPDPTDTAAADVWQAVADDVQYHGVPIAAVSTSWASVCDTDDPNGVQVIETQLDRLLAMGVTVFAASGDDGSSSGCTGFPSSSPDVVSVGGTSLRPTSTGWSETGWSGSGGGVSGAFPRPQWQANLTGQPGGGRLVPDIAADADPGTGLPVYWSGDAGSGQGWYLAGGTSLAAPLEAGLLAGTLSAAGRTGGLGDIHAAMYAAPGDFRDVSDGTSTGHYRSARGFDLVTGLGAPLWSRLSGALGLRPARVLTTSTGYGHAAYGLSGGRWVDFGGYLQSTPAVAAGTLFAVGPHGGVYARTGSTGWRPVSPAGTSCRSLGAAAVGPTDWVACVTTAHHLQVATATAGTGSVSPLGSWTALGGTMVGTPAVTVIGGHPVFAVTAPSGALWARTVTAGWAQLGSRCYPSGAGGGSGNGVAYLACATSSGGGLIYLRNTGRGWSGPAPLGGGFRGSPGVVGTGAGPVFTVVGDNGQLYYRTPQSGWTAAGGRQLKPGAASAAG